MPDKILYSPKEGTTGFWGLRDVPEEPEYKDPEYLGSPKFFKEAKVWARYEKALESCKEKKLEIVNPEILSLLGIETKGLLAINPGDVVSLPIGYEFKSYKKCQHNGIHNSTCIYHEVLRLVKTETKEKQWYIIKRDVTQPEPEESQEVCVIDTNRWTKKRTIFPRIFSQAEAEKHISSQSTENKTFEIFTIQRKKQ